MQQHLNCFLKDSKKNDKREVPWNPEADEWKPLAFFSRKFSSAQMN